MLAIFLDFDSEQEANRDAPVTIERAAAVTGSVRADPVRDAPATIGMPVVGRDERPRSSD